MNWFKQKSDVVVYQEDGKVMLQIGRSKWSLTPDAAKMLSRHLATVAEKQE